MNVSTTLSRHRSSNLDDVFPPVAPEGPLLDLPETLAALRRHLPAIGAILLTALLLGLASLFFSTPRYRASASVQIEQRSARILASEDAEPAASAAADADRFLQTQVDILQSRALATRVAQELRLFGDRRFLAAVGATPVSTDPIRARTQVIDLLRDNLRISLPRASRVVSIGFEARDPDVAAAIANRYATAFIAGNVQRRFAASSYSRAFLERQLAEAKARLEESERALIAYAKAAGLIDASAGGPAPSVGAEGPRSLLTANLVDLNQAYAAARAARIQAEGRWREAKQAAPMTLPDVLGNPAVQELTQRLAEAQGELDQTRQRLKPEHPTVRQQQARIAALDGQLRTLAGSLLTSIGNQYRTAAAQEAALRMTLERLKGQTLDEQRRGIRYAIIKREVTTNRELYDGLLQRYKEVSAEAGIASSNISIVDLAELPSRPIRPRPLINLALALSAGAALAAAFVLVRERFDDGVRGPRDVAAKLGLPVLGVVPRFAARQRVEEAMADPRSPLVEAHHAIRTALELATGEGVPRTILVTSGRQSEGKSTSAYALAVDLAGSGRRVLLIDADLRRPTLHRLVGQQGVIGLSSLLGGAGELDTSVRETDVPGLAFLPSGPLPPDPARLIGGSSLPTLLAKATAGYDAVVIDAPPLLALADAVRLAASVAATILVVKANGAPGSATKQALTRLEDARIAVAGAILTHYDPRRDPSARGYHATYGYDA